LERVVFPDARCKKCGGELTYCHLFDKNGGHHWRIWCEPCYSLFPASVTEDMRYQHDVPERDVLPLYLTYEQRDIFKGDPRRKGAFVGSGIGVDPATVELPKKPASGSKRPKGMSRAKWRGQQFETARQVQCVQRPKKVYVEPGNPFVLSVSELRAMPYKKYLETDHWANVRKEALKRAGHRCMICNGVQFLQVHHRTYERRGQELPEDVICLCGNCHQKFHGRLAETPL
jgi:5-methylcytosine-specific restriction endonuclease McrA